MNCDARKDLLLEHALGALEGAERDEVLSHLQTGCPTCLGRLAEAQAILALLPLSLDVAPAPAGARRRMLDGLRPAGQSGGDTMRLLAAPDRLAPYRRVRWIGPAILGAAVAASVTVLFFLNAISEQRKSLDNLKSVVRQKDQELIRVRTSVQEGQDLRRLVESPTVQVVTLHGTKAQPGARGRLIWDASSKTFHFAAGNLRNLPSGKAYELWLINNQNRKVPAGMCKVNERGEIELDSTLKADPGIIIATAITEEPAVGVSQPTSDVQLFGNVN